MPSPISLSLVVKNSSFPLLAASLEKDIFTKLPSYKAADGDLLAFVWEDYEASQKVFNAISGSDIDGDNYYIAYLYEDKYNDYNLSLEKDGNCDLDILNVGMQATLAYDAILKTEEEKEDA